MTFRDLTPFASWQAGGADRVVDYTREDFTTSEERYDALLDDVGNRSWSDCWRVLEPDGRYVLVGGGIE